MLSINMPYKTNKSLPEAIKNNLPQHAKTIFREAYNNAEKYYKDPKKRKGNDSLEETANKIAWSAVKQKYKKKGEDWVKK